MATFYKNTYVMKFSKVIGDDHFNRIMREINSAGEVSIEHYEMTQRYGSLSDWTVRAIISTRDAVNVKKSVSNLVAMYSTDFEKFESIVNAHNIHAVREYSSEMAPADLYNQDNQEMPDLEDVYYEELQSLIPDVFFGAGATAYNHELIAVNTNSTWTMTIEQPDDEEAEEVDIESCDVLYQRAG